MVTTQQITPRRLSIFKLELYKDESNIMHTGEIDLIKKFHFSVFLILGFAMNLACGILEKLFDTGDEFPPSRNETMWVKYNGTNQKILVPEDLKVKIPPYLPQNKIGENAMKRMYTNIIRMDKGVGRILNQLEEDGLLEKTIIVWYSDHGGPLPRQKRLLYDSGLRVPLIIRYPNKVRAGERDDRLISFVDFAPTLLSMVGLEPPKYMQGRF